MKTSTFERAMVQNAYTTPLRHEQLGHACTTPHSHQMGSTTHSNLGTGVGMALIITAIGIGYNAKKESTTRATSKIIKVATLATAAFTAGGYAQRY